MDASRGASAVAIVVLGCRVGRADAAALPAGLDGTFRVVPPGERADWVIVSTCSVTSDAAASSRQAIRRAAREHPGARIVVTGCHAGVERSSLAVLPSVAAVVEPGDQVALPGMLPLLHGGMAPERALAEARRSAPAWGAPPLAEGGPARPLLKVQDGCDDRCAYCVVPAARGPSRSMPLAEVVSRVAALGRSRAEVVLSGVNLGAWGRDLSPGRSLADLVRAVAAARAAARIRLSSVEPMEFPLALLGEEAGAILCEHFHLPMQSGSDRVLAAMGRPYRARDFARVVEGAARARPGAALGADVMTGFPGETEDDHRATLGLLEALPVAYLHVFPYSPRPGTAAAVRGDRPGPGDVERRSAVLRELSARRWRAFLAGLSGRTLEVAVERVDADVARGTSREYAPVTFPAGGAIRGGVVRVRAGDPGVSLARGVARAAQPS